jgi:DNA-binding NarL/FixJ family response regulator
MSIPRVLIADDHRIVGEGIKLLLGEEFDLVGVVEDGRSMVSACRELKPDVVVADIAMPHMNGIDAMALLKKESPHIKFVILTMQSNSAYARRAIEAGAHGYVLKHSAATELFLAVRAAVKGQIFVSPAIANELLGHHRISGQMHSQRQLTTRQREIVQLFAEGRSAKEIAAVLNISSRTVEFHKYQIMEQHGLHNTAELIHFALKHDLATI